MIVLIIFAANNNLYFTIMKAKVSPFCLILSLMLLFSCSDEIDKRDMYTFTGMTAADFIRSRPELSLFARLMDISQVSDRSLSTVGSLLGVYGNYTVFAPDNEAITAYLDEYYGKGNYSLDTIPEALARKIVNISVIDMGKKAPLKTTRLNSGFLVPTTLSKAHLYVEFGDFGDGCTVRLNDQCRILRSDMETDNGCVNIIDHVIKPGPSTIPGLIAETDNLRIFSRLLSVTSWADSMLAYEDYSYFNPTDRLLNYTVLAETDEVFQKDWGVPAPVLDEEGWMTNWNEILEVIQEHCAAITPEASGSDYTSKDNAVNQFVSYHLLPFLAKYDNWAFLQGEYGTNTYWYEHGLMSIPYRLDAPTHAVHYHQTMGQPNRLIQITYLPQKDREGLYVNRLSVFDTSYGGNWQELSCPREGVLILPANGHRKQYAPNGIYYPLNHVLTYDKDVPEKVLNTRIRYHFYMNQPDLLTNFISLHPFGGMDLSKDYCRNFIYESSVHAFRYQQSKYMGSNVSTTYRSEDITVYDSPVLFKLLPVPFAGEWEFRMSGLSGLFHCYISNSKDGYLNDLGILDCRRTGRWYPEQEIEYQPEPFFYLQRPDSLLAMEHNKQCRRHDIMYAPYGYGYIQSMNGIYTSARCFKRPLSPGSTAPEYFRFIIYRGYMTPEKEYWIKLVPLTKCYQKYHLMELVPSSVYNNPEQPEDWW